MEIRRGDVFWVAFGPRFGSLQNGTRPAVIVQNDIGNSHSDTFVVVPLTGKKKKQLPTHKTIAPNANNGLKEESIILAEQITTISMQQLGSKVGHLNSLELSLVDEALCISISLLPKVS